MSEEENIYNGTELEEMKDDDEINTWEEGFMEGEENEGKDAKCRKCGSSLAMENTIEEEFNGERMRFCSSHCAEAYEKNADSE